MSAPCGYIVKKMATLSEMVTSADSYQVNFPVDASPSEKLLLIITHVSDPSLHIIITYVYLLYMNDY